MCAVLAEVVEQLLHFSLSDLLAEDESQEMVNLVRVVGEDQIGTFTVLILHRKIHLNSAYHGFGREISIIIEQWSDPHSSYMTLL